MTETKDHWKRVAPYASIAKEMYSEMSGHMRSLTDESVCFGWLWIDELNDVCPETECALRSYCQQIWQAAQAQIGSNTSTKQVPKARPRQKRGTAKYIRTGYQATGRVVDDLVSVFVAELGNPALLPTGWSPVRFSEKYSHLGRLLRTATKSYHAILLDGIVVARFWTNAPKRAIVDIAPELVAILTDLKPVRCPQNSWLKVRPCTHRVTIKKQQEAILIANCIRKHYGV